MSSCFFRTTESLEQKIELLQAINDNDYKVLAACNCLEDEEKIVALNVGCFDDEDHIKTVFNFSKKTECKWKIVDFMNNSSFFRSIA